MPPKKSKRIVAYDFFQGIILLGMLFLSTFVTLAPPFANIEMLYRWSFLGFVFFFGLIAGEVLAPRKPMIFFVRRGVQILGIFFLLNLLFLPTQTLSFSEFASIFLKGDHFFVTALLLPLGFFFMLIPLLHKIPPFLGFFWSILAFFLMDIFFISSHLFWYNLPFFLAAVMGFFVGKSFSLNNLREKFHRAFLFLPFLAFYLVFIALILPEFFQNQWIILLTNLWTFHMIVLILLFFSIPALFEKNEGKQKPPLRQFLETLGVEPLFVYIFFSLFFQVFWFFPSFFLENWISVMVFFVHFSILCFLLVFLLKKWMQKKQSVEKIFRFLF